LILALVTFYPGSMVLLTAARSAWRGWSSSPAQRFCLAWLLPTWIACEIIPTKLPHYVLPVYPALALLIAQAACAWKGAAPGWREHVQAALWMIITLALVSAVPIGAILLREGIGPAVALWAALALAFAAPCFMLAWKGRLTRALWLSVFAAVLSFASLKLWILPGFDNLYLSGKATSAIASRGVGEVAAVGYLEPSLVFDLWPHITLADAVSAVRFLDGPGRRAVLISDEAEPEFIARSGAGAHLRRVWIGHGFNYTKGRWTTLTLYEKSGSASGRYQH
jgi:4-amino-4-deoxy-L-arabinose transferase-like glycosyltransferase